MALSIDIVKRIALPSGQAVVADATFGDYSTGGEPLGPADLGFPPLTWTLPLDYVHAEQSGAGSRICEYDYDAGKLKLFTALGVEATGDQSGVMVRLLAIVDPVGVTS